MKILDTSNLHLELDQLSDDEIYWTYNGLDCAVTYEIRNKLNELFDETRLATYKRALEFQAPFLEMMLRGVRVDQSHVERVIAESKETLRRLENNFNRLCMEGLGLTAPVNWNSPLQVKSLMYDVLGLPVVKKRNAAGLYAPSADREALEKLCVHFTAEPFCLHILAMRDLGKMIGFLETPMDSDSRMRCNFNLAGTDTGRLSSSFSDFGSGTNLQNVDRNLRYIFVPDPGKVFINIDLEQADSRNVGALCWNLFYESHGPEFAGSYLDACESGDLHTTVCRMAWTNLSWGEDSSGWRSVADLVAYRTYSYRDLAKKLGHGTNYYGQPKTMSAHSKVPVDQITTFQRNYFGAFPCIPEWHKATIHELQTTGSLTHLFGRKRYFFERLDAQSTINAAIAYKPQGMTGEEINLGIMNLWRNPQIELLIQVHDSILFQVDEKRVNELTQWAVDQMPARLILAGDREFFVPCEAKVGWNWGDMSEANPFGLKKFKGEETRTPPLRANTNRVSIRSLL